MENHRVWLVQKIRGHIDMIGNGHTTPATPEDDKQAQTIISNVEELERAILLLL